MDRTAGFIIGALLCAAGASVCLLKRLRPGMCLMRYVIILLLLPVTFVFGIFRMENMSQPDELKRRLDKSTRAELNGIVTDISIGSDSYTLTVDIADIVIDNEHFEGKKALVSVDDTVAESCSISDRITATGRVYPFLKPGNPGQFDEDAYYSARNTDCRMYSDEAVLTKVHEGFCFADCLCRIRLKFLEGIRCVLPDEETGIVYAMLTGDKGLLNPDTKELFSQGGIAHVLSISALHLTLLGMGFFRLLMSILKRLRLSIILTLMLIWSYGLLTGFSVSTMRAVIMMSIALLARFLNRTSDSLSSCSLAALIILIKQPLYIYDMGFQFSFTAVIAIFLSNELLSLMQHKNRLLSTFLPSFLISLLTLPISMSNFGTVNVYSVLINPAVIALMAVLLVAGLFTGVFGAVTSGSGVFTGAAAFAAGPVWFILRIFKGICMIEAGLPGSHLVTGAPQSWAVIIFYLTLGIAYIVLKKRLRMKLSDKRSERTALKQVGRKKGRKLIIRIAATVAAAGLCMCIFIRPAGKGIYAAFLDVGQGDAIYFEYGEKKMLMDCGSSNVSKVAEFRVIPFLKNRGVSELDAVFISHKDADHTNGIIAMLAEGFPVIREIYVPQSVGAEEKIIVAAREAGCAVHFLKAADAPFDGIRVLAPEAEGVNGGSNESSLVLDVHYGDFAMLLTGDSGSASEKMYTQRFGDYNYDILKVAHHGSRYSTSNELLESADVKAAIISCYRYNTYGHPHSDTLKRLADSKCRIFRTDLNGAVIVNYQGGETAELKSFMR